MKNSLYLLILIILPLMTLKAQSGPPAVNVTVTIINKCEWPVPVRLERSKYSSWLKDFGDATTKNGWVRLKPNGETSYTISKGVGNWFFFIKNTTTGYYTYSTRAQSFDKNTTITVTWEDDDYKWTYS